MCGAAATPGTAGPIKTLVTCARSWKVNDMPCWAVRRVPASRVTADSLRNFGVLAPRREQINGGQDRRNGPQEAATQANNLRNPRGDGRRRRCRGSMASPDADELGLFRSQRSLQTAFASY